MFINSVRIRNFRSIVDQNVELRDLNVVVGNNDAGKSNFLKALNLFFNGETDSGTKFRFSDDYCLFAPERKGKAKEIAIEIKFTPPKSYMDGKPITWKKSWRSTGEQSSVPTYSDGTEITGRTKAKYWLNQLRFRYVPANKGADYFSTLLCDLHDVLAQTIEEKLQNAGAEFIHKIRDNTKDISKYLLDTLGMNSQIQLPSDLRGLFSTLEFQTEHREKNVFLKQRGDGIKTRHIPAVLKFIAEQENESLASGSPRIATIWGYEEPENNLELSKTFEVAKNFQMFARDLQILVTTHSPAFYLLKSDTKVSVSKFIVLHEEATKSSAIQPIEDTATIDKQMGLLSVVAPYVQAEKEKSDELQRHLDTAQQEIASNNSPTLFVEGNIDAKIFRRYRALNPKSLKDIAIKSQAHAGANWVKDMILAWAYSRKEVKAGALFDSDTAGSVAKNEVIESAKFKKAAGDGYAKAFNLSKPEHLQEIFKKGIVIPISIEELFSETTWLHAQKQDWLEERDDVEAAYNSNIKKGLSDSFKSYCTSRKLTEAEMLFVMNRVKSDNKEDFADYICSLKGKEAKDAFSGFERTVTSIQTFFSAGPSLEPDAASNESKVSGEDTTMPAIDES